MVADWVMNTPDDMTVKPKMMSHKGEVAVKNNPAIEHNTAPMMVLVMPKRTISREDKGVITMPTKYNAKILASCDADNV